MSAHITQEGVPYCHFANLYLVKQVIERDDLALTISSALKLTSW